MDIDNLPKEYIHKIAPGNIIRVNLRNEKDALKWVELYGKRTSTIWTLYKSKTPPKLLLHKAWICRQSGKDEMGNIVSSSECKASIDIKIKRVNKGTKLGDMYLNHDPPLSAVISLNLEHKHDATKPISSKVRPQDEELKDLFYEYFWKGMDPVQALNYHIKLSLSDNHSDKEEVDLGDVTFQPQKIMYTWYSDWKSLKSKKVTDEQVPIIDSEDEDMPEESVNSSNENLNVKLETGLDIIDDDSPEVILVKTEVSMDTHDIKESTLQVLQNVFDLLGDDNHVNTLQSIKSKLMKITTKEESIVFLSNLDEFLNTMN